MPDPRIQLRRLCDDARCCLVVTVELAVQPINGGERKHCPTDKIAFKQSVLKYLLHHMTRELAFLRVGATFLHPLCPALDDWPCCVDVSFEPTVTAYPR